MDPPAQTAADNLPEQVQKAPLQEGWKRALLFAVATVLLVGTLFFAIPDGLSAIADSIPAYLRGWAAPGVPLGLMLVSLLVYELFPLVFGVWGGVLRLVRMDPKGLSLRSLLPVDRFLLAWWIIALVLALAYPGRQVSDLAWSLLPLWGLAARQVARMVSAPAYDRLPMFGQMALAAVILAYISMALFSVANGVLTNPLEYRVRLAGALIMLVASTALIAWGWSGMVALRGASWGLGILLMITMISAGWNAVGLSGRAGEELWSGEPRFTGANLLAGTLSDLNQLSMPPQVGGPDVVVVGMPSPALDWVLRGVRRISYTGQLPGDASPSIVITNGQPALALASTYRGQNFVLSESTGWNQFQLVDWLRWLAFRTVPAGAQQQEQITLWARSDLFPGGSVKK